VHADGVWLARVLRFAARGGTFEMIQLWVNLPKKHKMHKPGYQALTADNIPVIPLTGRDDRTDGYIRVIAGEANGTKGAATTFSPVNLWDVVIAKQGGEVALEVPAGHTTLVFGRKGGATFLEPDGSETKIEPQQMALLKPEGTTFTLRAPEDDTQLVILTGEPLNEPIAARGPFVMNTQAELRKANEDYRNGKMGR